MLYLVLAIISLWDVAPVPLATAAAQLTSRLESTGLSSQPFARHEPYATFGSLIAGGACTFGSPPLTSRLHDDAVALYRSFSTPECADERPLMSLDFTKPWIPFGTPVRLEPAPLRDVQEAASHADTRTTIRYDRARGSLDRHATYIVAAYLASAGALVLRGHARFARAASGHASAASAGPATLAAPGGVGERPRRTSK